jgi:GTP-binding protein EngB required for normal cell division
MVSNYFLGSVREPTFRPGGLIVVSPTSLHVDPETTCCKPDVGFRNSNNFQLLLGEAINKLEDLGEEFVADGDKLSSLRDRFEEGRFHLAVLGQFKRGKSTLLNALLGHALLPTSVVPLTAIPTFVQYGSDLRICVRYRDGKAAEEFMGVPLNEAAKILEGFVTEEGNPKNRLGVTQVEIMHPATILQHGVVLIDTPGVGSTFTHNTRATLNFLPQCDAALFVVSADPPLTEVETEFLKLVKSKVERLFFIFNKIDYLTDSEKEAALGFFKRVLAEKLGTTNDYPIFCVSTRRGLDAKLNDDSQLWTDSGLQDVEDHLVRFMASEKAKALQDALSRKARDSLNDTLMRLRLSAQSLRMPIEDLEQRLEVFNTELKNAEREKLSAQDLLAGDMKRTLEWLEQEAEGLRKEFGGKLERIVEASVDKDKDEDTPEQVILDAMAEEVVSFFQTASEDESLKIKRHVTETLQPHQQRADELIERVRKAAAQLFEISYHAPDSSEAFETKSRPYWVQKKQVPSLPIVIPEEELDKLLVKVHSKLHSKFHQSKLLAKLLPENMMKNRRKKRLYRQIDSLVTSNVENLRWATLQNVRDAFQRFGLVLDQRFQDTIAATHGAIHAAYVKRKERSEAIADELARFETAATELGALFGRLQE